MKFGKGFSLKIAKSISVFTVLLLSLSSSVKAEGVCVPTTDKLYVYSSSSGVKVTNHGGTYDSSKSFQFDYTRNCQVSPIVKILIKDNFGTTENQSSGYGGYEFNYINFGVSNCWQTARVSAYGQSEWSNQVCYVAPVVQPVSVTGIFMYLNSSGEMDGDVYINWANKTYSDSLYWTACPPSTTWNPSNPGWSWEQSSYANSGQTVFTGAVSEGVRCYQVSAKNANGVLSLPFRVEYTYAKWMAQPYSVSPKYVALSAAAGGTSYAGKSSNCVGICYGVPSIVNGLPRNSYVSGYYRSNGTYVKPYTRSKP